MPRLISLLCFVFVGQITTAQNIFSALHLNEENEYKTVKPKKILETNTYFDSKKKTVKKAVKIFDDSGMLLTEEEYDEERKTKTKITYTNDTLRRVKLASTYEQWTEYGNSTRTSTFRYDEKNFLIEMTDKRADWVLVQQSKIRINEKGHPVELLLYDGDGGLFGKETADYLYDRNQAVTSVFASDGRFLSSDTIKIDFRNASSFPLAGEAYNSRGDLIASTSKNFDKSVTYYEYEYDYDEFGNCLEERIFEVTIKANGKRKRELDRIFKKEYTYQSLQQ